MATLQSGKCFTVPTFFGMCCRSEWQERMYIYKWHEVDQTKHEIFCVHIVCNEIQVKVNLEITTFFFYLRFPYCPNFFWFGVVVDVQQIHIFRWTIPLKCRVNCKWSLVDLLKHEHHDYQNLISLGIMASSATWNQPITRVCFHQSAAGRGNLLFTGLAHTNYTPWTKQKSVFCKVQYRLPLLSLSYVFLRTQHISSSVSPTPLHKTPQVCWWSWCCLEQPPWTSPAQWAKWQFNNDTEKWEHTWLMSDQMHKLNM